MRKATFAFLIISSLDKRHPRSHLPICQVTILAASLALRYPLCPYALPSFPTSDTVHEREDPDYVCRMQIYSETDVFNIYLCQRKCGFPFTFIPLSTATLAVLITIR